MSKEFEEVVIEKLTNFEGRLDNIEKTLLDAFNYLDHKFLANKVETDNYKRKSFQQEVRISALENLVKNNAESKL